MAQDSLFEQLKHPNPNLRQRALVEIVESCDETTIPKLMANLDEEDVVYRRASVKTLGAIGADTVPPLLEVLLNHDDVTARGSAAKALAQVALNYPEDPFPADGIQGLKTALNDPNPVVSIASAMALGEIGEPALEPLLEVLAATDNVALEVSITNAIASIGGEKALNTLAQLAENETIDTYVKETAVSALSRLALLMKNQPG